MSVSEVYMFPSSRVACCAAILTFAGAHDLFGTVSTPTPPSSLSIATYYNWGSGFYSAWQPGDSGNGAAPSSGSIIRLSAFYRDSDGTVWDLGQGSATATITLNVSGYGSYPIGPTAACSCRSVEFDSPPGVPASTTVTASGVTLGTRSAYTLVMTVASTPDPSSPITAAFQYGGSNGSVNLEQNQIVYTSAQNNVKYVGVRLVQYTSTSGSADFLTYSNGSGSDSRTIYFKLAGDANVYSAVFTSSTSKVIVPVGPPPGDTLPANATGIIWWQTVPGDETVFAWFYPSTPPLN
jgi:hypothetical protein